MLCGVAFSSLLVCFWIYFGLRQYKEANEKSVASNLIVFIPDIYAQFNLIVLFCEGSPPHQANSTRDEW